MATIVLTAIGDDKTGLVDALAGVIRDHGGNWERSHMAQLAGKFAGIVVATVPDDRADQLVTALEPIEASGMLDLTVEVAHAATAAVAGLAFDVELVGQDRAGIIHELAHRLAEIDVSIDELETLVSDAPMGGGRLFEAEARVTAATSVTEELIEAALADLGRDFQIEVSPSSAA